LNLIYKNSVQKNVPHVGRKKNIFFYFPDITWNKTNDKSYSVDFILSQQYQYQYQLQQLQLQQQPKHLLSNIQQQQIFDRLKKYLKNMVCVGYKKLNALLFNQS
jgi:hypothetical protein